MPSKTPEKCQTLKKAIYYCVTSQKKLNGSCDAFYSGYTKCLMTYYEDEYSQRVLKTNKLLQ